MFPEIHIQNVTIFNHGQSVKWVFRILKGHTLCNNYYKTCRNVVISREWQFKKGHIQILNIQLHTALMLFGKHIIFERREYYLML